MAMIVAAEWYRERAGEARTANLRNAEADARNADALEEKVYE
jgi:hypothetical protein